MSMIDIYVRDKNSGKMHRVGDDIHDMLTINDDVQLCYHNLQNGDGCHTDNNIGGYEFVPNQDEYGYNCVPTSRKKLAKLPSAEPETHEERTETHSCDCISRKAAIDAIMDADVCVTWNGVISDDDAVDIAIKSTKGSVISSIVNMPSAQPDSKELSGTHKALDTVSRQAVIEAINKIFPADPMRDDYTQGITCGAALANIYVAQLPSAQPETHEERTETHSCDCISRQAAIDTLHMDTSIIPYKKAREYADATILEIRNRLEKLPSAEPETHEERTETHSCDYINRKDAIDAVENIDCSDGVGISALKCEAVDDGVTAIKALPSAQPELPEWVQKVEEYRKSAPSFVRNQLVWALYQTWKEYDGRLVHQIGKENR